MNVFYISWKPDADVCGEAAGLCFAGRVLDLVVTYGGNGLFYWEVVDACMPIASGTETSAAAARRAAETAARLEAIRAA